MQDNLEVPAHAQVASFTSFPVTYKEDVKLISSRNKKMDFFKTELFVQTATEETTQEVTKTSEVTTTSTTTQVLTEVKTDTTEENTQALIPILESKKDIILLAMAGTIFLAIIIMMIVCVCRRRKPKRTQNLELFESLAASSSTTVFDKDQ